MKKAFLFPILILAVILASISPYQVSAGATGQFTNLVVTCSWVDANGGSVTTTPPAQFTMTAYDGNGTLVLNFSGPVGIGTFTDLGANPFNIATPVKNPIHAIGKVDGQTVLDLIGNDPCLPPPSTAAVVPVCLFTDGRVNCKAEDAAQTAAIYCSGGGVTIFAVNNSVGKFAFTATAAEIAKVPANPDKNTLIKEALNIALWRLHGGKLQVNAPNDYVYTWGGC